MKKAYLFIHIFLLFLVANAISGNLDSIQNLLKTKTLSANEQLKLYDKLSWDYINLDAAKAKYFGMKGIELSLKEKNDKMCGILYHHMGIACYNNSEMDSAWYYFRTAENFSKKAGDNFRLNRILVAYSILYGSENDYENSIKTLLQLIPRLEMEKDGDLIRTVYGNLGSTYLYIHNYQLAEKYYQLCAEASINVNDDWSLSQSHNGLIDIYLEKQDYKTALEYADKALDVAEHCGDFECQALTNQKKSEIYNTHFNDFDTSLEYGLKGLNIARNHSNISVVAASLINLSNINYKIGNYRQSMVYALEAFKTDTTDASVYENISSNIVKAGIELNDKENAARFLNTYKRLVEIRNKKEIKQFAIDSEKKYQTERKELEILKLKQRQKLFLISFVFVLLVLIFLVTGVYLRLKLSRQKRKLAEQRIIQLEQEKQLIATQSLLKGEEIERSRLAGDLHDGLGGLLTGVKLKLSSMKENSIITSENLAHFNHALDLLDTSIAEMRRVAHNLMPETLMHYGLQTALTDFVKQVSPEGTPQIRLSNFGDDLRYSKELEVTVYRITQELVNNALKHAQAQLIDVQLFTEIGRICVQVIDNGTGFIRRESLGKTGKGLQNIDDRITAFNGHFEILSEPGKGTECTLEFLIS